MYNIKRMGQKDEEGEERTDFKILVARKLS